MKRLDTRDASNRKWRTVERPARRDGQRDYRVIFAVIAAALLILAIDAVLIMIRV